MEEITNKETPIEESITIEEQLQLQQQALTKIYASVEKTRKIMLWTGIASIAFFVLPLIVVAFAFPFIINTFTSSVGGLTADDGNSTPSSYQTPSLSDSLKNLKELGY